MAGPTRSKPVGPPSGYYVQVSLRPEALRGPSPSGSGVIDHRLARRLVLQEYRAGHIDRADVCDAHPELKRAAKNCGTKTESMCPICEDSFVVLVTYAFGPRLAKSGRMLASAAELQSLRDKIGSFTCYVVEVCPNCSWNHLGKTFEIE